MDAVQLQSEKVRTLKREHAPQVEVTAAIEELKRLKALSEAKTPSEVKTSSEVKANPPVTEKPKAESSSRAPGGANVDAAAEKIRVLKSKHASQVAVSQAVAEYKVLKSNGSLDPVAIAEERVRLLKSANASLDDVVAAIDEYKKASQNRAIPEVSKSATPAQTPGESKSASKAAKGSAAPASKPEASLESLSQKVKTLKATGAPQEQVAAAVAEFTAFKNEQSVDPKVVGEAKVRALKEARAPQGVVQSAVDELKSLKGNTENSESAKVAKSKSSTEQQAGKLTSEKKEASSGSTQIWESESFDDFQARMGLRTSDHKKSLVSATGLSPPLTTTSSEDSMTPASHNFQEKSDQAERRILELSALCDKFKSSPDVAELQRLRAENTALMSRNATLRKAGKSGAPSASSEKPNNDQKTVSKPAESKPSGARDDKFSAWQKNLPAKCSKLSPKPDGVGWPGQYWIDEAIKHILAAENPTALDGIMDPETGIGRAAHFILKQVGRW